MLLDMFGLSVHYPEKGRVYVYILMGEWLSNHEDTSDKPQMKESSVQKTKGDYIFSKHVRVIKDRERLWETLRINVISDPLTRSQREWKSVGSIDSIEFRW